MSLLRKALVVLALAAMVFGVGACEKKTPVDKAGEDVKKTMKEAEKGAEKAAEDVKGSAGKALEEAGEAAKKATE